MDVSKRKDINVFGQNWNALGKIDYVLIARMLLEKTMEQYDKHTYYVDIAIRNDGTSVTYSLDEFNKYFSNSAPYESLSISSSCPQKQFWIRFNSDPYQPATLYGSSQTHTIVQVEDMLNSLSSKIGVLYESQKFKSSNTNLEAKDLQKCRNCESSQAKTIDANNHAPFYKSSVFWAAVGSVAAVASVIVAVVLKS